MAYSRAEPRNCPVNWFATRSSSRPSEQHLILKWSRCETVSNLCVDGGLDNIDHHVRCYGVRLKVKRPDGFVWLKIEWELRESCVKTVTSNVSHNEFASVSVRSQLQAERVSTVEFSFRAENRAAHFSLLIHLRLLRFMSSSSGSLAVACWITSSMLVLLGASAGKTYSVKNTRGMKKDPW